MRRLPPLRKLASSVLNNLGRMLSLAWATDKKLTLGFYGTSGVGAFFPIITAYIYKLLVDNLIQTQGVAVSIPVILVAILGAQYLVSITQDLVLWGLRGTYFEFLFRYKLQNALNYKFFRKVSSLDIAHLENPKTQDMITKAEDTLTWRPPDFLREFAEVFGSFVTYSAAFFILLQFNWWIPFVLSVVTLPRLYLRARFGSLQWSIYGSGAPEVRKLWLLRWLLSNRLAVTESRILQSRDALLKRFKGTQEYLYQLNKKPVEDFLKVIMFPGAIEAVTIFLFAYLKLPAVLSGTLTVGDFTFFISLLSRLTDGAGGMVLRLGSMYENNFYVSHYFDVLNLPTVIKKPKKPVIFKNVGIPLKIEFKNVSFAYPRSHDLVLEKISFTIGPGENVALVGPNGAGKTTIVKLLCRFYDVGSGEILINGINIKKLKLSNWYKFLGTLFQEFIHYDFTVRENIMIGNWRIKNEKMMKEAARLSGADKSIEKLPKKYDQLLGREFEGGVDLSQGEWQKLAIARAFYEGAPILILDEPTSMIDAEAEYEIFNNLLKTYKNKTLLLISHRFSTVRNASKIIVLQEGQIVEQGSHKQLLQNNGLYARMFRKQAKGYV